jgi:hypothetical protein
MTEERLVQRQALDGENPFATITLSPLKSFDEVEVAAENTAYRIEWAPRLWHGHHVNERREYPAA